VNGNFTSWYNLEVTNTCCAAINKYIYCGLAQHSHTCTRLYDKYLLERKRDELPKDYLIKIIFHVLYGLGLLAF